MRPEDNPLHQDAMYCSISKQSAVKFSISAVFTLPFLLSTIELAEQYPAVGMAVGIIGLPCIFRIGWVLYAEHFIGLCDPAHELAHISNHLVTREGYELQVDQWSVQKKLGVSALAVAMTLPLGLTKIGLASKSEPWTMTWKIAYLVLYSVIDAAPHVNHLQLQKPAINKFGELPLLTKLWVPMLMIGHALSDSADLWNASGFWLYWIACASIPTEIYLSNVEAVAHHNPHFPQVTVKSAAKFASLFIGACTIAIFNWYNTFKNFSLTSGDIGSKIAFIILQFINLLFITFETWHHDGASHSHGNHHSHGSHGHNPDDNHSHGHSHDDDKHPSQELSQHVRNNSNSGDHNSHPELKALQNAIQPDIENQASITISNNPLTITGKNSKASNNIPGNFGRKPGARCNDPNCYRIHT